MNRAPILTFTLLTTIVLDVLLAGCQDNPPAKDGGVARIVSLSAVAYTTNALTGETLDRFRAQVDGASEGSVVLKAGPAVDAGAQDGSSDVIGMVRDGTADIGVVAARTFDLEGSTSLQALNLPFVLQTPAQAAAFLTDPVTERMLSGLDRAGVVGLALTYDTLRQPLGYTGPLRPDQLDGAAILARPSKATSTVLNALGAVADPRNGDDGEAAIKAGEVLGAETSVERPSGFQSGIHGHASAITANLQLSVKANVIIVNRKVWAGLGKEQQGWLRTAALATRAWSTHQAISLSDAARAFCDQHIGDVVVADAQELTAWRAAVEPAISQLAAANPLTREALARMRQIVTASPATDLPSACTMAPANQLPSVEPVGDQSAVAGQWRLLVSAEKLAAAGASSQDVGLNQGTWTFTFDGKGGYSYVEPRGRSCSGEYAVNGDRLSLKEDASVGDCDGQWELTLSIAGTRMTWRATPEFEATYPPLTGFLANALERIAGP